MNSELALEKSCPGSNLIKSILKRYTTNAENPKQNKIVKFSEKQTVPSDNIRRSQPSVKKISAKSVVFKFEDSRSEEALTKLNWSESNLTPSIGWAGIEFKLYQHPKKINYSKPISVPSNRMDHLERDSKRSELNDTVSRFKFSSYSEVMKCIRDLDKKRVVS